MKIKWRILLILILIGLSIIVPLAFHDCERREDKDKSDVPSLNPEHLTEEYEFKDTKVLWRIEEDED